MSVADVALWAPMSESMANSFELDALLSDTGENVQNRRFRCDLRSIKWLQAGTA